MSINISCLFKGYFHRSKYVTVTCSSGGLHQIVCYKKHTINLSKIHTARICSAVCPVPISPNQGRWVCVAKLQRTGADGYGLRIKPSTSPSASQATGCRSLQRAGESMGWWANSLLNSRAGRRTRLWSR